MTGTRQVVVADRFALDRDVLARELGEVAAVTPVDPAAGGLPAADLVLLDAESDDALFFAACRDVGVLGLLYDEDSPRLRERASRPEVALVAARGTAPAVLRELVTETLDGRVRRLLPSSPTSGGTAPSLSPRETEVLHLMARGLANQDIATTLDISPHTVRTHVQSVLAKFNKGSRVTAVGAARRAGLLTQ